MWGKYLDKYWDNQLKYLIRYGIPVYFNSDTHLSHKLSDHGSGNKHPKDIKAYLAEEIKHISTLSHLSDPRSSCIPIHDSWYASSPSSQGHFDLSFPAGQSVNAQVDLDAYLGSKFLLTLPTIENIINKYS